MNLNLFYFSESVMSGIGYALLNSLWQAAIIAGIVYILLRLMKNYSALSRYYLASSGLILIVLQPIIAIWRHLSQQVPLSTADITVRGDELVSIIYVLAEASFGIDSIWDKTGQFFNQMSTHFVWFWLIGMLMMMFRLGGGYLLTYRLKTRNILPVDKPTQKLADQLAERLKIRRKLSVMESLRVDFPMVIGYFKPVVVIPFGLLGRIPFEQVEMILAHELAHVKRADFLVNLLQSLIEVILFFNPFVWWLSSVIRHERENICDDLAMSITGKQTILAKALVSLSEKQDIKHNTLAVYFNKFKTMKRIERIFNNPRLKPSNTEKAVVSLMAIVAVIIIATTGSKAGADITGIYKPTSTPTTEMVYDVLPPDTLNHIKGDSSKLKKEILLELEEGRIIRAVVDGKEIAPEELEKKDFTLIDKDTTIMKRVELKGAHPRFKTLILETDKFEWRQNMDTIQAKRFIFTDDDSYNFFNRSDEDKFIYNFEGPDGKRFSFDASWRDSLMRHIPNFDSIKMKEIIKSMRQALSRLDSTATFRYHFDMQIDSVLHKHGVIPGSKFRFNKDSLLRSFDSKTLIWEDAEEIERQIQQKMELLQKELEALPGDIDKEQILKEVEMRRKEVDKHLKEMELRRSDFHRELKNYMILKEKQYPDLYFDEKTVDQEAPGVERKYLHLLKGELIEEGIASRGSLIVISGKQTIIDGQVLDNRTHKRILKRLEQLTDKKLEKDQAMTIR